MPQQPPPSGQIWTAGAQLPLRHPIPHRHRAASARSASDLSTAGDARPTRAKLYDTHLHPPILQVFVDFLNTRVRPRAPHCTFVRSRAPTLAIFSASVLSANTPTV